MTVDCRYMLLFQMEGVEDVIAANDFALWRLMAKNESEDASFVERQIAEWKGTDALQAGRQHSQGLPGKPPWNSILHPRNYLMTMHCSTENCNRNFSSISHCLQSLLSKS